LVDAYHHKEMMKERSQEVQEMVELSQECNTIIQKESGPEKLEELVVEDQLQTPLTKSQECNTTIQKESVLETLEKLAVEDQLQTSLTKGAEAKSLPSKTLISKKAFASNKVVAWTDVMKGVLESKTEVMARKEACPTLARPPNSTSRSSSTSTYSTCSHSTPKLDLHVEENTLPSDNWLELQKKSK